MTATTTPASEDIGRLTPEEQDLLIALGENNVSESLDTFIRRMVPREPPPPHLMRLVSILERARREELRVCVSMPPRHAKTTTALRGLAWWLTHSPADTCAFLAYNSTVAESKSRICRDLVRGSGDVALSTDGVAEWRTVQGGGLLATGVGGGLTGYGINGIAVVDDPYKSRLEADSVTYRERVWEWFNEVVMTRLEGASVVVVHTRWHPDDLTGRLSDQGWEVISLPAEAEERDALGRTPGEPLWPRRFGATKLARIRKQIGEFSYAALYQQRPRPRGARVFGQASYYEPGKLDLSGWRIGIGVDPAASQKTTADYSVAVALAMTGRGPDLRAAVLDVARLQVEVPDFLERVAAMASGHGHCPVFFEAVGGFKAVPQFARRISAGLNIKEAPVMGDKFQRAQAAAAAWNDGRLLVPTSAPWLRDFLRELEAFTGVGDAEDDQVDGLSHGFNGLEGSEPVRFVKPDRPLWRPRSSR